MGVRIMDFPETRVAAVEHRGPPYLEHQTVRRLVEWRIQNGLPPARHSSCGVHYTDPHTPPPDDHRVDFCVSVERDYPPNPQGVMNKAIPGGRRAVVRHLGARVIKGAGAIYFCSTRGAGSDFHILFPIW